MTTHLRVSADNFSKTSVQETIEANLIAHFDWGFIDCGAYTNVVPNISGAYGDFSRLRYVNDPNFSSGKVWEGIRGNWVWESGLQYGTPLRISGVYVNNAFTTSGFKIDYNNGRVIFDSGIATNSNVRLGYSYKEIQFLAARNNPLFKQVQSRSRRPDDTNFLISSGNYLGYSATKINLPVVSIEVISRKNTPYQIGGGSYANYVAKFHILGESDTEVNRVADIICDQYDRTIFAFDLDTLAQQNAFPLKFDGTLASGARSYPDLVASGFWTTKFDQSKIAIMDCKSQQGNWIHQNLYMNTIDMSVQVVLPPK